MLKSYELVQASNPNKFMSMILPKYLKKEYSLQTELSKIDLQMDTYMSSNMEGASTAFVAFDSLSTVTDTMKFFKYLTLLTIIAALILLGLYRKDLIKGIGF